MKVGSLFVNRCDFDGGNKWFIAVNLAVAFWKNLNGGKLVFLELVRDVTQAPAKNHHVGDGKRECQFLRWFVLVILRIRVFPQRVMNQLARWKTVPVVLVGIKLDGEAIFGGAGVALVFTE